MRLNTLYIVILLSALAFSASAQRGKPKAKQPAKKQLKADAKKQQKDTATLKGATIEILQSYKPEVKPGPKPEPTPSLPPVDVNIPKQQYTVPPQSLYYTYNSLPLRPLILSKDSVAESYKNYAKLSAGNLSTLLIDAGFGGLRGKNFSTAIHAHYLKMEGNIANQKSRSIGVEAEGVYYANANDIHAALDVYGNKYNRYGFALATGVTEIPYSGVKFSVDLKPSAHKQTRLFYNPAFNFLVHSNGDKASERMLSVEAPFVYTQNDELKLYCGIKGVYDNFSQPTASSYTNNSMLQLSPGVKYNKEGFSSTLGLYPTLGTNNVYLLPDIDLRYTIKGTQLSLFGGLKGMLKLNNFEAVSTFNPYVYGGYNLQQTHANDIFGGVETNIGNHITLAGKLSYLIYDNMQLFVNDTSTAFGENRSNFLTIYDKVNALSLQGSLSYHIADIVSVGVTGIYTTFNADKNAHAWHEPGIRLNGDLSVQLIPELSITAYLSVMDELYAIDSASRTVKLPAAFDLGAGIEYSIIPRLSAFVQVKNIFNSQYQRWYGYQVYGLNAIAGVRFKF